MRLYARARVCVVFSAPSAAPTDMRFWPLSSGDLSVSWLAVDETHWNGHYQGYRIYYYPSSAGRPKLSVFTANTSNAEIKNIPVGVPHTYELQLITSGGMGPAVRRTGVLYPTRKLKKQTSELCLSKTYHYSCAAKYGLNTVCTCELL